MTDYEMLEQLVLGPVDPYHERGCVKKGSVLDECHCTKCLIKGPRTAGIRMCEACYPDEPTRQAALAWRKARGREAGY